MEEQNGACVVERGRATDETDMTDVREGCVGWRDMSLLSRIGRVVCSSLELCVDSAPNKLPSLMIALALSNDWMSKTKNGLFSGLVLLKRAP